MITAFDDYPIHQTSRPMAYPESGDANHYDRYFFNGYTANGELYFAAAMGLYPNRSVHDAAFCVVRGGKQVSVHASARAPLDRALANVVGPIEVRVVEPLRELRLLVDAPEQGIRADVTFRRRTDAFEEPHFFQRQGTKVFFDYTRLTQMGRWSGWIEVDGERIDLSPAEVVGSRDRSWGIRPVGERLTSGPAPSMPPQFFWLWAPLNFPNFATHFDVNEDADGRRWHETVAWLPADDGSLPDGAPTEPVSLRTADYTLAWGVGTRHATAFELRMHDWDGATSTITLEPILNFQMLGIGYGHPEWSHGLWKGDAAVGGTRLDLPADPAAAQHLHIQALCKATFTHPCGQVDEGVGILEQLALGEHRPSGLTGIIDGWRPPS